MDVKALSAFFDKIEILAMNAHQEAVIKGIKKSAPELQEYFKKIVVDNSVWDYYNAYPSRNRTYSLFDAFDVQFKVKSNGFGFIKNIETDASKMAQHHSHSKYHQQGSPWRSRNALSVYNAAKNEYGESKNFIYDRDNGPNGIPDNSWIFDNFWKGLHPVTSFSDGEYEYSTEFTGSFKQNADKHIKEYNVKEWAVLFKNIKSEIRSFL